MSYYSCDLIISWRPTTFGHVYCSTVVLPFYQPMKNVTKDELWLPGQFPWWGLHTCASVGQPGQINLRHNSRDRQYHIVCCRKTEANRLNMCWSDVLRQRWSEDHGCSHYRRLCASWVKVYFSAVQLAQEIRAWHEVDVWGSNHPDHRYFLTL